MNNIVKFPLYIKLAFILLILIISVTILYFGQKIFIPVTLSLLFAILLRPIVNLCHKRIRLPHVISVLIAVLFFIMFILGLLFFVSWQIGDIAHDWNKIQENLSMHYHNIQLWVEQKFHISYSEQDKYIKQATRQSLTNINLFSGSTLSSFTNALLNATLIPFLVFLFLLYRNLLLNFLSKIFTKKNEKLLQDILFNIKLAIQSFLLGLLFELILVAALISIGYMITGIKYPVLLGVITGILNLIPYIGILVASVLSIASTLTSSTDVSIITSVVIVNVVVQLIDNNIITPLLVSSKVKINALVCIVGILIGNEVAGIAGMFLTIPIIAILKVIFDRIESLEPWGFVMGDNLPKTYRWRNLELPSLNAGNSSGNANGNSNSGTSNEKQNN